MNIKKPNNCLNCKAKAELVRFGDGLYQCRCTGCGSLGRLTPYKSDAVKYWNEEHRPEPETLPESVAFVSISAEEYAEYMRLKEAATVVVNHEDFPWAVISNNLMSAIHELSLIVNEPQNG